MKALRHYEDLGLLYTLGRSPGNYRLFGDEALWCVRVVSGLRSLGLTLAEIEHVARVYLDGSHQPIGPVLAELLRTVRSRTERDIVALEVRLARLDEFEAKHERALAGRATFREQDPRSRQGS